MMDNVTYFIVAIIYIAIVFTLVRPKSKGPTIVQNIANALSDLVRGVAGETFDPKTNKWSANG
jgi:F0F1-type ATP synthase membrane subunit a